MEELSKAGTDGMEIWAMFSDVAGGRFAGNMDKLSKTFQGVMSNLQDFGGLLLRVGGQAFFEEVRDTAIEFLDILNANEAEIVEIATAIGDVGAAAVSEFRNMIQGFGDPKDLIAGIKSFTDGLMDGFRATKAFFGQLGGVIKAFIDMRVALSPLNAIWNALNERFDIAGKLSGTMTERLRGASQVLAIVKAALMAVTAALGPVIEGMGAIAMMAVNLVTGDLEGAAKSYQDLTKSLKGGMLDLDGAQKAWRDSILESAKAIDEGMNPAIEETKEKVKDVVDTIQDVQEEVEKPFAAAAEAIEGFSTQMIDAARNRDKQLEEAAKAHGERRFKILEDFEKSRAKLAQESADASVEAVEEAEAELAELTSSTQRELSEKRKEFDRDELRETEDHLNAMRQLEQGFLANLKDAVADRDAVAIVKLRERHMQEKSEREQAFSTQQARDREDADQELARIRENEAAKREAIQQELAQELQQITENEAQKAAELQIRRDEQLAQAEQNFANQQQQIEQALARQLETIARNMADQAEISEEGAREVLNTFNEVFGIDGDIDKMMEDFVKRRELKASITLDFEARRDAAAESTPSSSPSLSQFASISQEAAAGAAKGEALGAILGTSGGSFSGIRPFAAGGELLATKPTLALFGEREPERVQFTPISNISNATGGDGGTQRLEIEFGGSAPPGIGTAEVDRVAGILLMALRQSGVLEGRGG
jgi:hypothetical protein